MQKILLTMLLVSISLLAMAADVLSPELFTEDYAQYIRSQLPQSHVEIKGQLEIRVKGPGEIDVTAYLDNAYSEYKNSPEHKDEIIGRFVAGILETVQDDDEIDRSKIIPVVKDRGWLVDAQRAAKKHKKEHADYAFEPINNTLVVLYAEDRPQSIKFLTVDMLKKAGLAVQDLRPIAVKNLMESLPEIKLHGGDPIMMITAGGNFEASLLVVDELWTDGQIKVKGDIVVGIPTRDLLLITGSKNKPGLKKIRELTKQAMEDANYILTDTLFVFRQGKFVEFKD